jgi:hypothetical protein
MQISEEKHEGQTARRTATNVPRQSTKGKK